MKNNNSFTLTATGAEHSWREDVGFDLEVAEEAWERADTAYSLGGMVWDEEPTQDIARFRKNVGSIEGSVSF